MRHNGQHTTSMAALTVDTVQNKQKQPHPTYTMRSQNLKFFFLKIYAVIGVILSVLGPFGVSADPLVLLVVSTIVRSLDVMRGRTLA